MRNPKLFILLILSLYMLQCSAPKKEDVQLVEAARIHNETVALAKQLEKQLDQIVADSSYLKDSLNAWRMAIEKWKSNLVEVAGHEHHDHQSHDHHDHGKQMPELTSDQMLEVQQELKAQLDVITIRINAKHK